FALAVQGVDVVRAADVFPVDEDLREGGGAARALDHLGLLLRVVGGDDVGIGSALAVQQGHGADAVGAAGFGVENDFGQEKLLEAEGNVLFHLGGSRAFFTLAMTARSTARAPASIRTRAQASAVAPVVSTSSTRSRRRPLMRRRPASVTAKAVLTFRRRPRADLPPWLAVGVGRIRASGR